MVTETQQLRRRRALLAQPLQYGEDAPQREQLEPSWPVRGIAPGHRGDTTEFLGEVLEIIPVWLQFHDIQAVGRKVMTVKVPRKAGVIMVRGKVCQATEGCSNNKLAAAPQEAREFL